jgi:hypothetical protein
VSQRSIPSTKRKEGRKRGRESEGGKEGGRKEEKEEEEKNWNGGIQSVLELEF